MSDKTMGREEAVVRREPSAESMLRAFIERYESRYTRETMVLVMAEVTARARELDAAHPAPQQPERRIDAWVGDMKTSAGMDYYVCVGYGTARGEYLTPNVYKIRWRAECDVAEWKHMLGLGPKPDILAFDTEAPQQPAEKGEAVNKDFFVVPEGLDPRTTNLVARFATALAEKLAAAERKYGYRDDWAWPSWMDECREKLVEHVAKGDPRDVAAYCAFLWHHGEKTAMPQPDQPGEKVRGLVEKWLVEVEKYAGTHAYVEGMRKCADELDAALDNLSKENGNG